MERRALTTKELLDRAKNDLVKLRFQFEQNEKNLLALIKQYEVELNGVG